MKDILVFIVAVLIFPSIALAGTLDIGFRQVEQAEMERAYHLSLDHGKGAFSLQAEYNYGEIGGEVNTDDASLSLGYDIKFSKRWEFWIDETVRYAHPAGIKLENLLGGGPKYIFYRSEQAKGSLSFGYLSHYQEFLERNPKSMERWSWRFKFKRTTDHAEIGLVSIYQPAIGTPDDYISEIKAWYSIFVTDTVALKLSMESKYRSPEYIRKLSQIVTASYKFD